MIKNNQQLNSKIRRLELQENDSSGDSATKLPTTLPPAPAPIPQAVQQLRNGDASHSVRTWFETVATDDDENKECAHWYSHNAPAPAQFLYENNSKTGGSPNAALKNSNHSAYASDASDWYRPAGSMGFNGTRTIDAPLPSNSAAPGRMEYVGLIAARRNQYISIPSSCRMFGGLWDNTSGQNNWLRSANAFSVSAEVVGTPAGTVERRYRVFARTDRGYSYLTGETAVMTAPNDASFTPSVYVALKWSAIPNTVSYYVYRYTPSTGEYLILKEIGSGATGYNDNNRRESVETGYPSATDDRAKAYFATREGELVNLAIDAVASRWDTITLPIKIPADYNQSLTTDKQWLRLGLTAACDLKITDAATNSAATVTSAAAQFESGHTGLSATITDGTNTLTATVTYVNADEITLSPAPTWTSANNILTITGGGFRGVDIDLVHMSYQSGAVYAPYPEDLNRALPPAATPNGSTQGGIGDGGTPSGGINCVEENELVAVWIGETVVMKRAKDLTIGDAVYSGSLMPNYINDISNWDEFLWRIETGNGLKCLCSPSHPILLSPIDATGKRADALRVGDRILTYIDGATVYDRVTASYNTERRGIVRKISLSPNAIYVAGHTAPISLIKRLINFIVRRKIYKVGGIYCHNQKPEIE